MRKNCGFTVVELITVIMIVGVLAAVAVPSFKTLRLNSQISAMSGDMAATLSQARSLAISKRTTVFVIQGAGTGTTDVAVGADWNGGWRILRGATLAAAVQVTRVQRMGSNTDVRLQVNGGSVDSAGTMTGTALNGFAFNNFGQLMLTDATTALTQAAMIICVADGISTSENGRAISISRSGRVSNQAVTNPASCGS
ncbi:MAG: GspH/FimT family pseudopilin [Pedobacter sp.]|nr:GspH/FimT family pseudopilin [Pedobacter sp.]